MQESFLLIVPDKIRNIKVNEINKRELSNTKVTTFNEIKKNLFFDYDEKAIYYIMKNYNINYELSKIYIENMYFIENKQYNIELLDNLVKIKKELEENNILIKNDLYKTFLKSKKIIIQGYIKLNAFQKQIIEILKKITEVEMIIDKQNDIKICFEFNNVLDEISYVFEEISNLLAKGIDINDISILNVKNEYINTIKLISDFYKIPINLQEENYLYGTSTSNKFLKKLYETKNIKDALSTIENTNMYNAFIDICNKYIWCMDEYIIPLIVNDLKQTKIPNIKFINAISINEQKKYNFLIGFNNTFPQILRDDDYLSDDIKKKINQNMSYELNNINKAQTIYELKMMPNLVITYSLKSITNEYFKSSLIDEMNLKINTVENFISRYSDDLNRFNLIKYLDLYMKYGEVNTNLLKLYNKYNIKYLSYDNKYNSINKNELTKYLNNKLTLSYTSLNDYYNCKFKYYLSSILKINKNNDLFHLIIGNLYHYILSVAFKENFDFEKEVDNYLNSLNRVFTNKEKFFINKLTENLKEIIEIIKNQKKYISLDKELYEKKIFIDKSNEIKITLMGVIDKLLYKNENNKTYAAIIDYKTGNPNTSLDNIEFGIDMQLPIYLYLIKKEFKDIEIIGIYYQKLLHKIKNISDSDEEIKNDYKLIGYTIDKEDLIKKMDFNYEDSSIIKGMKKGKNGFYSYTKLLNEEKVKNMIDLVDKKIDNAIKSILDCDFKIDPKRIEKYSSCENCIYSSICYKTEKDIVYLSKER